MKTKLKFHADKVTDFYDKKVPKVDSYLTCLAVISLDSALKKDENYYPQQSKHIEKKVIRHINDNFRDLFSSDDYDEE